jgi:hypothetical protein
VGVVERGQQMPAGLTAGGRSAQGLPVDRDPATATGWRTGPFLGPRADRVIEGIGAGGLQHPPERRLTRHHIPGADLGQGLRVGVSGPLPDRDIGAGAGQHRAHRQPQHGRQPVTHSPRLAGIGNPRQDRQHPRAVPGEGLTQVEEVADLRSDR